MSKKEKEKQPNPEVEAVNEEPVQETPAPETPDPLMAELESLKNTVSEQEEKYLRLAAEYDNFRKRTQKEKEGIYGDAKTDAVSAFLPVYDNLERAMKAPTADEAYAKGVEMTMNQLREVLTKLGVEEIPSQGLPFDPNYHNAVMHVDDESVGENTIVDVFQSGFKLGDKVIRFAMVKVAN